MKSETIKINNAPHITGLRFRSFAGEVDYPRMKAIIDEENQADGEDRATTVADIRVDYAHLTNSDPQEDMLFAEIDGKAIAYSRVEWHQEESPKNRIYAWFVKIAPQWRNIGIEKTMLSWCETRLMSISKAHSQDGARFLQTYSLKQKTAFNNLLESLGYQPVRYFFEMSRALDTLPTAALPDDVEVRPVKKDDVRKIWEASEEAFRDHWGFSEPTEEDFQWFIESKEYQPDVWKVAWSGEEIVGSVLNYIDHDYNQKFDRKRGWTENITTHRDWRRKGIARGLIARSMQELKDRGMTEVALGVDAQNLTGALSLYENLGYVADKTRITYRKSLK